MGRAGGQAGDQPALGGPKRPCPVEGAVGQIGEDSYQEKVVSALPASAEGIGLPTTTPLTGLRKNWGSLERFLRIKATNFHAVM